MSDEISRDLQPAREVHSLVTWAEGERMINDWFRNWWIEFEKRMIPFEVNWRGWQGKRTAFRIFCKVWAIAHVELYNNLLPQSRKRVGLQRVKTGRWRPIERRGGVEFGYFNGKPAWKRGRGRPPLSETEYVERLRKRIAEMRRSKKTNITHKDRKKLEDYTAPKTKIPRPTTGEAFGKAGETPERLSPKVKPDEGFLEQFTEQLFAEIGKVVGELGVKVAEHYLDQVRILMQLPPRVVIDDSPIPWWLLD